MIPLLILAFSISAMNSNQGPGNTHFLFYLHGMIVENMGLDAYHPQHGKYEYEAILATFNEGGTQVISEVRPKGTNIQSYAEKVVSQIEQLISEGVSPTQITVMGASKGALITMEVSAQLKNTDVNFILIAGHIASALSSPPDLHGHILGFWEMSDPIAGQSYQALIDQSSGVSSFKEVKLETGLEHGIVFHPLDEWVIPAKEWMRRKRD